MRNHLLKMFAYESWANRKLLEALSSQPTLPPLTQKLCGHIFAAHQFMDKRLHSVPLNFAEYNFFPDYSLDQCKTLSEEYGVMWPELLRGLPEPISEQTVSTYAPDGTPRKTVVVDLMTHLCTHSIHHRGQIAMDMRAAGLTPVATDYVIFCRETAHP